MRVRLATWGVLLLGREADSDVSGWTFSKSFQVFMVMLVDIIC